MPHRRLAILTLLTPLALAWTGAPTVVAQPDRGASVDTRRVDPRSLTLARMLKTVTVELSETRMEDLIRFIEDASGAELEPIWFDENPSGLDRDAQVTIAVRGSTYLTLLERALGKVSDEFDRATWQMTPSGFMEIGPRSALNRRTRTLLYDVNDLLFDVPTHREVPDLDLGDIQEGGGSGSQTDVEPEDATEQMPRSVRIENLAAIIMTSIEPDQWIDNGGDAASIREWNGVFIVKAPDYIHRQIAGAPYWPSERLVRQVGG